MEFSLNNILEVSKEVKNALKDNHPVVGLESTILTHGFEKPTNYELALETENIISSYGVVPATIALINGKIKVGLSRSELKLLCFNKNIKKLSTSDLSSNILKKNSGGTTVAASLFIANLLKIKVFVTGGIGGVHRNFEKNFDISADLVEISKSNIFTICSGPKAILDVPKTIENLETLGIQFYTYKNKSIPQFWSRSSEVLSNNCINDINDFIKIFKINKIINRQSGMLIFNPIPKEHEIPYKKIDPLISKALKKAKKNNILGKQITPFLLAEINKESKGLTIGCNKELLYNNAKLGAEISSLLNKV